MTKEPIIVYFCVNCRREVYGKQKNDACPVCGSGLIQEAT